MGIVDGLEKLITEHGSAVILKERLALVADQYAALEKKLADSTLREKQLESESQRFELENLKLKEKVRNLEEQLTQRHGQRLEEVKEKLLHLLVNAPPRITAQQLAVSLNVNVQLATFHLTEMENNHLVHGSYRTDGSPPGWSIAQDGRGYLVRHGLLV